MNNEQKIVKFCQERDNMGDCYLLKETTEAMCAVIAAARHISQAKRTVEFDLFEAARMLRATFQVFDELVIE